MSLVVILDEVDIGSDLMCEYLSTQFPLKILPLEDATRLRDACPSVKCVFTTSPSVAQITNKKVPTILYVNDNCESYRPRGDNISAWRQNLMFYKGLKDVFVASSSLATAFLQSYRTPCKVQYPYVPRREKGTPSYVLYNSSIPHLEKINLQESFLLYSDIHDFRDAKVYVHVPAPDEQWNINIMLAHTHGVPCVTFNQGCFPEFCTSGDRLLSPGADANAWATALKTAVRDHTINSKIVYEMSQRFHAMNEIQQRIKKALAENGMIPKAPTFAEVQTKASGEGIKRLQERKSGKPVSPPPAQKIIRPSHFRRNDFSAVNAFLASNTDIYAGTGGMGDALLTLAMAQTNPEGKIIFGANGGVRAVIQQLFESVQIGALIIQNFNGSAEGVASWNSILDHHNFKGCAHIPRSLDYGDWGSNSAYYLEKTVKRAPFIKTFGKMINPRATKKIIGIAPRGSDHTSTWKQRYLSRDEYHRLLERCLEQDATVVVFGSESDLNYYGIYPDNNVIFMSSNFAVSHPAPRYPVTMRHMLSTVNACDEIISVDTWLKTYAALAGIPCQVIMNRYFGRSTTEHQDPSDKIFLDTSAWGFQIVPIEDLI